MQAKLKMGLKEPSTSAACSLSSSPTEVALGAIMFKLRWPEVARKIYNEKERSEFRGKRVFSMGRTTLL